MSDKPVPEGTVARQRLQSVHSPDYDAPKNGTLADAVAHYSAVTRRPAWLDDPEALREAARESYERLLDDGVWIDHNNYRLGMGAE